MLTRQLHDDQDVRSERVLQPLLLGHAHYLVKQHESDVVGWTPDMTMIVVVAVVVDVKGVMYQRRRRRTRGYH